MSWTVSAAAAALLASNEFTSTIKVEVWKGDVYLQDLPITGGSVSEDETASPRRTLTLTVENASLVPEAIGDLLHPLSGNELRPYWGIVIPGETTVTTTLVDPLSLEPDSAAWDAGTSWNEGTAWDSTTGGSDDSSFDSGGDTSTGDGSFDSGSTIDSEGTIDAPSGSGGGGGTGDGSMDSGASMDSGTSMDSPTSPAVIPPSNAENWDSGTTWDQGNTWDVIEGDPPQIVFTSVEQVGPTTEWVPLGVFRMTQPSTTYTGASTIITINGHDRSSEISLRAWTTAYTVPAVTVDTAIEGILKDRWGATQPALTFNLKPVPQIVPPGTVLGVTFTSSGASGASSASGGNDPWADCVSLAQSVGCELLFDRQGIVVMRSVPSTATVPVTSTFVDGANSRLVSQVVRELDETTVVNQIVMIGTGTTITNSDGSTSPGAPLTAIMADYDPSSPTYVNGQFGVRPKFITNSAISDQASCQAAAVAAFILALAALDDTSFEAIPDPTVDAGDCDELVEPAVKASGTYIVSAVTHPLDFTSTMQITNRPSSVSLSGGGSTVPDPRGDCSPGTTYSDWYWPGSSYTSFEWTFVPLQDPDPSLTADGLLHYYAYNFYLNNSTAAVGGGYAGFQTNGFFQGTAEGKVINFSIWGSVAANSDSPLVGFNPESGGYQIMFPFSWDINHPYAFSLRAGPTDADANGNWWGLYVTDTTTSTTTYIGEQQVAATIGGLDSTTWSGHTSMFGEDEHWIYSTTGQRLYECSDFQNSSMACIGVTADTGAVSPSSTTSHTNSGQTTIGSNGYSTVFCDVTVYTSGMEVQHNLGYWSPAATDALPL